MSRGCRCSCRDPTAESEISQRTPNERIAQMLAR